MVKLSLIVPIYGVEKYINGFLSSLEKNLQIGIEVLLINDGTKDNSDKIAEQFALKHRECVRVVHKENGGASSARNYGLQLAKGEYVIFPDSDDLLADNYVITILDAIRDYNEPDIVFFDYYVVDSGKNELCTVTRFNKGIVHKDLFIKEFVKDKEIKSFLANKAIKKSFYDGVYFNTKTRIAEDYEVLTDISLSFEKIIYIPIPLYFYVMREGSLTHSMDMKDILRYFELSVARYKKFQVYDNAISMYGLVKVIFLVLREAYIKDTGVNTTLYESIIKRNIFKIFKDKAFSCNEKKHCLFICLGLSKLYHRIKYNK